MIRVIALLAILLGGPAMADDTLPRDFAALQAVAADRLDALDNENDRLWFRSNADRVDFNLRSGTIRWEFSDKIALARVELLGVWARSSGEMIWGWTHPLAPRGTAVSSAKLRRFAEKHGIDELNRPVITCSREDCEIIAGIAVALGKLSGMHSVALRNDDTWAFLGFGRVKEIKENGR